MHFARTGHRTENMPGKCIFWVQGPGENAKYAFSLGKMHIFGPVVGPGKMHMHFAGAGHRTQNMHFP